MEIPHVNEGSPYIKPISGNAHVYIVVIIPYDLIKDQIDYVVGDLALGCLSRQGVLLVLYDVMKHDNSDKSVWSMTQSFIFCCADFQHAYNYLKKL